MSDDRNRFSKADTQLMRLALRLAKRAYGQTSPNPLVGAVLTKRGQIIGQGWHRRAGAPHAEIEAIRDAEASGYNPRGGTLYVTLEPCCTLGRTPPCVGAIQSAGIARVVVAATDPNPKHAGRAYELLANAGIRVKHGLLAAEATRLNETFNHWIVHRTPFVTVKAAMTLDGKIATAAGESKWITGDEARAEGMKLRQGADAILVGINTILADDPSLTARGRASGGNGPPARDGRAEPVMKCLRRIILDSSGRLPLSAQVASDEWRKWTTVVATRSAPKARLAQLARKLNVWVAPSRDGQIDLRWLLRKLGSEEVTHLIVEGGGEVNASFLLGGLAQRIVFFYAPKILGGTTARKAVAGTGAESLREVLTLRNVEWRRLGVDLGLTANLA